MFKLLCLLFSFAFCSHGFSRMQTNELMKFDFAVEEFKFSTAYNFPEEFLPGVKKEFDKNLLDESVTHLDSQGMSLNEFFASKKVPDHVNGVGYFTKEIHFSCTVYVHPLSINTLSCSYYAITGDEMLTISKNYPVQIQKVSDGVERLVVFLPLSQQYTFEIGTD